MILEFFGPPAAGKTTLALAVADQLRKRGHKVDEHLSLRPAERSSAATGPGEVRGPPIAGPLADRIFRPLREFAGLRGRLSPRDLQILRSYLCDLPPWKLLWTLRLGQYLLRMRLDWEKAEQKSRIVIFDQGYMQFICSIALHSKRFDRVFLQRLIALSPMPDALILVDAPKGVLESRLMERSQRQSFLERMLEFDLKTNLVSSQVITALADVLADQRRTFFRVSSSDPSAPETIMKAVATRLPRGAMHPDSIEAFRSAPVAAHCARPLRTGAEHFDAPT